ncbi:T9SS type A sorting domain-containing protein [Flammeovirga aprica]|uniref:T9SS type A sorting domain-containing protein n=1 Tax=Flammeovirga aprica JL-4 TaxID=694437 RepID=A0A7X9P0R7_9BACT|nr:T9SS type A sorting domain-containing protein [Flammeovirga aprica]NME66892.1 T9SS type A sorting domain-containing protein [Flammeovirga aprica JL-4]
MKVYLYILGLCLLGLDAFATTYYSRGDGNFYTDDIWATTEGGTGRKFTDYSITADDDFIIQGFDIVSLPSTSISIGSITVTSNAQLTDFTASCALTVTDLYILGQLNLAGGSVGAVNVENIYLFGASASLRLNVVTDAITHSGLLFVSSSASNPIIEGGPPNITGLLDDFIDGTITGDNILHVPTLATESTLADLPSEFSSETVAITLQKDYTLKISNAIHSAFTISAGSDASASNNGSIEFLSGASGTFMPANDANPFLNLTINTSSGITLGRGINIGGVLKLTDGIITTSGNTLAIVSGGSVSGASYTNDVNTTISGGSNASHVDGTMSMVVSATNDYVLLPVGDNSLLRVGGARNLVSPSPSDFVLTMAHTQSAHSNNTDLDDVNLKVSLMEYWDISVSGADVDNVTKNFNVVLSYHTNSGINTASLSTVHLMHYRGAKWYSEGDMGGTGTHTTDTNDHNDSVEGFIEAGTATFSPFTLGGDSSHDLPITLKSFDAEREGDALVFNWTTAQEINNDFFELEGSTDKKKTKVLASIDGAGNSNVDIQYSHTLQNWNSYQFFRLKQTDFDGKYSYSDWVQVENNEAQNAFDYIIYPNPSSIEINVETTSLANETINTYQIFDLSGKRYHTTSWNPTHHTIDISTLPKGIYMLMISTLSGKKKIQRFTVQ